MQLLLRDYFQHIVIRPTEPVFSSSICAELSMKVVSNKYLLKNDN